MSFNLHVFFQSFTMLLAMLGVVCSILIFLWNNWWPLRIMALLCAIVLMACFLALLIP